MELNGLPPNCTIIICTKQNHKWDSKKHRNRRNKCQINSSAPSVYLHCEGAEDDTAEDRVVLDPVEHVSFPVDFPSIDLIEELHHDEAVEDDGVVLRWRSVERGVAATVNVKYFFTCKRKKMHTTTRSASGVKRPENVCGILSRSTEFQMEGIWI